MASLFHDEDTLDCCLALKAEASGVRPEVVVTVRRPRRGAHLLRGAERRMALYMARASALGSQGGNSIGLENCPKIAQI